MEFKFDCATLFGASKDGSSILDQTYLKKLNDKSLQKVQICIDTMGELSRVSQKLPAVLTTYTKTVMGCDN